MGYLSQRKKQARQNLFMLFSLGILAIIYLLLFFGEKLIQNPIHKKFDKIFKTNVFENGKIKSYKEILSLPQKQQKNMLKSKNWAYGLTFATNTMAIAAAVALLNRIATKQKFLRDNSGKIGKTE